MILALTLQESVAISARLNYWHAVRITKARSCDGGKRTSTDYSVDTNEWIYGLWIVLCDDLVELFVTILIQEAVVTHRLQ